jgi:hypothetical protein
LDQHTIRNTRCAVTLVTPENVRLVFEAQMADSHLLQVSTHNDLAEACGGFRLTFAPIRTEGRTYDQLIPMRSLVTIRMEGVGDTSSEAGSVVMVGLTEDHAVSEDYSRAQPQRIVTVSGRSLACVFLDMQLRHFPQLEGKIEGTLTVGDQYFNLYIPTNFLESDMDPRDALRTILTYFLGVKSHLPVRARQAFVETQQDVQALQATHPDVAPTKLAQQVRKEKRAPVTAAGRVAGTEVRVHGSMETVLAVAAAVKDWDATHPGATQVDRDAFIRQQFTDQGAPPQPPLHATKREAGFLTNAPPGTPQTSAAPQRSHVPEQTATRHNVLMNLQLPDEPLANLLDINDDTWTVFDDEVRVPIGYNTPYALSLWNYMGQFIDHTFQEFFTRVEGGVVKVFFRPKPFSTVEDTVGSRFAEHVPTCQTLEFTREAWEVQYLGSQLRRQASNVYNAFQVLPLAAQTMFKHKGMEWLILPHFLAEPTHPSFLGKYGLRELRDESPYLSTKKLGDPNPTEAELGTIARLAKQWSSMAAAWYSLGSEMYAGVITVVGSSRWNIGHRLLFTDERGQREFYIEGVEHQYDIRTGRYLTQLRVTRGWYLSGLTDERGAQPGWKLNTEIVGPQGGERAGQSVP